MSAGKGYALARFARVVLALIVVTVGIATMSSVATAGIGPVSTYGVNGVVRADLSGSGDFANILVLQNDGKALVAAAGTYESTIPVPTLLRYNTDGTLDTSFGSGGKVLPIPSSSFLSDVKVQPDGRILVAGLIVVSNQFRLAVVRYNTDGSVDTTFGTSGTTIIDYGTELGGSTDSVDHLGLLPNGQIIAAAETLYTAPGVDGRSIGIARLTSSGAIDTTYGTAGITNTGTVARRPTQSFLLQADGKMVFGGETYDAGYFVFRMNADGSTDTSFGTAGQWSLPTKFGVRGPVALVSDSSGRIVAGGSVYGYGSGYQFGIARLTTSGQPDASFGTNGFVHTDASNIPGGYTTNDDVRGLVLQADGKIVAVGSATTAAVLVRYNVDGTLDTGGIFRPDLDAAGGVFNSVVVTADGSLLVAGRVGSNIGADVVLARYASTTPTVPVVTPSPLAGATGGYWLVAGDGGIFSYGDAAFYGSAGGTKLNQPIVSLASATGGHGYWLVASDGGIFSYGGAAFFGSAGSIKLNKPIVGLTPTPSNNGYWMVASDGGIFAYGDAKFFGSTGSLKLNKPIVGMAATSTGNGYWLVASDGGIFAYGDAQFLGSTGGTKLNQPIVALVSSATGNGYWMVASDGGIFNFGDAAFYGSAGGTKLNQPIVGMARTSIGSGYWLVASDGGIFAYGDATFWGSTGGTTLNRPIVAMAR